MSKPEMWYLIVNDLIGGWAIGNRDKPLSEYDTRRNSGSQDVHIGDINSVITANEIIRMHNEQVERYYNAPTRRILKIEE